MSNKKLTVIEWITYEDVGERIESFGGLGGWFAKGMRWNDYADRLTDEGKLYAEALRESILKNNIREGGNWHQSESIDGVPLFSDDTVAVFSYRAWGDLLAAIWSTHDDKDYSYYKFYMSEYWGSN